MTVLYEKAYGKLNLTLDILGRRDDGYHDMSMIMQSVDLCDDVTLTLDTKAAVRCTCGDLVLPEGKVNLAVTAAEKFFAAMGSRPDGYAVEITKRIPVQGGMAGGSSDAAAVLRCLYRHYGEPFDRDTLMAVAASVGSDVPYCVLGGTALAEGRGEILTKLPNAPQCTYVLVQPQFSVSTPALFREYDGCIAQQHPNTKAAISAIEQGNLADLCRNMSNVFQPILNKQFPIIGQLCDCMTAHGALAACLTGTGSVVFGVYENDAAAKTGAEAVRQLGCKAFLAHPV